MLKTNSLTCACALMVVAPAAADMLPERVESEDAPVSLSLSMQPLVDHFNAGRGKPRFVAIVSSTCPACVFGAKAVKASVLDAYPDADIQMSIVWIDMLGSDNEGAALKSSAIFRDEPRVRQFYDPNQRTGRAFARGLLNKGGGVAWDIYLYYDKDALWQDKLPGPVEWYHQLSGGRRADASRFRPGDKLTAALKEATGRAVRSEPIALRPDDGAPVRTALRFNGAVLRIEGMTCTGCAHTVSKALAAVPGVEEADVSFETREAWVSFADGKTVVLPTLIDAVKRSGFKAAVPDVSTIVSVPADLAVGPRLQVLSFEGCPNAGILSASLKEACAQVGLPVCLIEHVNLGDLDDDDPRRAWGSPTILVDGADLMGLQRPASGALSCRIYPANTLPTAQQIAQRLRKQ